MKTKNAILLSITTLMIGFSLNNIANSANYANIAVVDVNSIVAKSTQVQNLKKEQQKKTTELQNWLKTVQNDINKQQTKEGKEKLVKKYDAEFAKKKAQIAKEYNEKLKTIDTNITNTIATEAKAKGYTMVLSKNVVLFGGDDITQAITGAIK